MKKAIICLLVFTVTKLTAQNWSPFPEGIMRYNNVMEYDHSGGKFSNAGYDKRDFNPATIQNAGGKITLLLNAGDTMQVFSDSVLWSFMDTLNYVLHTNVTPGAHWSSWVNTRTMVETFFDSVVYGTMHYLTDSFRCYHQNIYYDGQLKFSDVPMYQSKQYGLLNYAVGYNVFGNLSIQNELNFLTQNNCVVGNFGKSAAVKLPYQSGQVRIWKVFSGNVFFQYYYDTILSVTSTSDSACLQVSYSRSYSQPGFPKTLYTESYSILSPGGDLKIVYLPHVLTGLSIGTDIDLTPGRTEDMASYNFYGTAYYQSHWKIKGNNVSGLYYVESYSQGPGGSHTDSYTEMLYRIALANGVESVNPADVMVYPTPAYNEVMLQGIGGQKYLYQLISIQGETVQQGIVSAADRLYIGELASGIYFLRLQAGDDVLVKKVVKQ